MQRIVAPKTEYLREPIGLGEALPRLSWKMDDARRGARQTAFQVVAASRPELLAAAPDLWDTGRVVGGDGTGIPWGGAALTSRRRVFWRVRVWDAGNHLSDWSETASFEMGLLETGDWKARWIGRKADWSERSCPFLRRVFRLDKPVLRARAHVTARGVFELHLNGSRVGKDFFAPGWTDYGRRLQVSTYDVTSLLREGENVLGSVLGDGWYAGRIRGLGRRFWYGRRLSLLVQLEVEHPDGSRTVVAGDRKWKSAAGPIHEADFYDGETYDARREMPGWSESGFDDSEWKPVVFFGAPTALLVSSPCPPIRRQEELPAKSLSEPLPGVHVFDLGQNMTGFARVALRQRRGRRIVVRFAEMLQADGTLYTANLRTAKCTDTYICRGGGEECFEPHFTFHGFRYVELSGLAGKPRLDDIVGVVLHADMSETGRFSCSDERLNRLHRNIVWSQKGNFLGIPTDCPQRDERLGWTAAPGRHDDLGALEQLHARARLWRRGNELVQPLRLRRHRRMALRRSRRNRSRPRGARVPPCPLPPLSGRGHRMGGRPHPVALRLELLRMASGRRTSARRSGRAAQCAWHGLPSRPESEGRPLRNAPFRRSDAGAPSRGAWRLSHPDLDAQDMNEYFGNGSSYMDVRIGMRRAPFVFWKVPHSEKKHE